MNKTIFTLCLGAAFAAPSAMSSFDISHFAGTPTDSMVSLANTQSKLATPSTLELMNGVKSTPFEFDFEQLRNTVNFKFDIAPNHRLYVDKFTFTGTNTTVGNYSMPKGKPYHDEFFGNVQAYEDKVSISVPFYDYQESATVDVTYQGCKDGFCYPPETKTIQLLPFTETHKSIEEKPLASLKHIQKNVESVKPSGTFESPILTLGLFFLLGLGLSFTPCVLPMYPILSSIVLGGGEITKRRALALSAAYTQGMAVTYTGLGLVVASAGMHFQAALQHPAILIGISAMFVALSLSMFGAYNLQMPSSIQTRINNMTNKHEGGNLAGVFAMGAISGLVLSPCTTAPLSGALLYVAQSGDVFKGGLALYALATGMGIPLVILTTFGSGLLPKAGSWMNVVKTFFGFVLLSAPIFLLERILDEQTTMVLWLTLGLAAFVWLLYLAELVNGFKKKIVEVAAIIGISTIVSVVVVSSMTGIESEEEPKPLPFGTVTTLAELKSELASASQSQSPVMLDLYADWCSACKQFEKYTFSDENVQSTLSEYTLIKVDVTANTPKNQEILKYLGAVGLPTIEFWNEDGKHCDEERVSGFLNANDFENHVKENVNQ